jgi:hypothetical protein
MASQVEVKCILLFHESGSAVTVQRRFCGVFGREPPARMLIDKWHKLFVARLAASVEENGLENYQSLKFRWVKLKLSSQSTHAVQQTTVQKIVWKCLKFKTFRHQLLQYLTSQDKEVCYTFCCDFIPRL